MENKTNHNLFFIKFQDAINSSFILFETKLEDLLYSLAKSELVYSIVAKCLKDYNYSLAKAKCLVNPSVDLKGGFYPPEDRRDFIAFSFSLLHEVFDKKILFTDLIDMYFDGIGYKDKFEDFKSRLLIRLYNSMLTVVDDLKDLYSSDLGEEKLILQEKIDDITLLKNHINEQKIKFEDKEYLVYFIDAITNGKSQEVCLKAIYYILSDYKRGNELYEEILEALKLNESN